jgi:hypothetical protein
MCGDYRNESDPLTYTLGGVIMSDSPAPSSVDEFHRCGPLGYLLHLQHPRSSSLLHLPPDSSSSQPFAMFSAASASSSLRRMTLRIATRLSAPATRTAQPAALPSIPASSRSIAHVCSHSHPHVHPRSTIQALTRSDPQSTLLSRVQAVQTRGFKVRSSVKKMCDSCFVVRRSVI